jgi:hypothetical protein
VADSQGEPQIRRLAAFNTGAASPQNWNASAHIWAADAVGEWKDSKFEVDLTAHIKDAAQYRVRFIPATGKVAGVQGVELMLDGAPAPRLVKADPAAPDTLILTMTAIGQKVILRGTVTGAEQGTILLQKM